MAISIKETMLAHRQRSERISELLLQASRVFSCAVPRIKSMDDIKAQYSISTLRQLAKIKEEILNV